MFFEGGVFLQMSKLKSIKKYIPLGVIIIFAITIVSAILYVCFKNSVRFADFFNLYVSAPFRIFISSVTSVLPFSLAETAIILSPVILAVLIFFAVKFAKCGKAASVRYFLSLVAILCCIFITFVWTYSSGYYTTPIDKRVGIEREKLSKDDLYKVAVIMIEKLNTLSDDIVYDENGASLLPYSYNELSKKICKSYDTVASKYGILINFRSNIKPILLSEPFTYTHISGVYSFMTGESNLNVNYPDFILASSAAHELAHQRGIARENEANFVAFLACVNSDDVFLQYSGYLDVYSYVTNALYSADKDLYKTAYSMLDTKVRGDLISYSQFFRKYANSHASQVTDKINNSYLNANGQTEGTKSYGMVTDLVCAYFLSENN